MNEYTLSDGLRAIHRAFDLVDPRLKGHGEQTALLMWRPIKQMPITPFRSLNVSTPRAIASMVISTPGFIPLFLLLLR